MKSKKHLIEYAAIVLTGIVLIMLCQFKVIHSMFGLDDDTLPLPSRIVTIIVDNPAKFGENALYTVIEAVLGLILGSIIGYFIAVLAVFSKKIFSNGLLLVSGFSAIPIIAIAPVMTNWTRGISDNLNFRSLVAKILTVTIVCIAPMSLNAYKGLTKLKPFADELMKSYAASKLTVFVKLRFPNSIPFIFTALRISIPLSVISAIVSEYFAEYIIGVGRAIRENFILCQYPTAWAYIVVSCLIAISLYVVLLIAERFVLRKKA